MVGSVTDPSQESWSSSSVGKDKDRVEERNKSNHTCLIYFVGPQNYSKFSIFLNVWVTA